MTKSLTLICLPLLAQAWFEQQMLSPYRNRGLWLRRLGAQNVDSETDNPCWQDLYDEDCSMDKTYASSFVVSEWLKKMPCASGIEDCDIPDDLKIPGNREEGHPEDLDVMKFLNLKRAPSVYNKKSMDGGPHP